MSVKAIQVGLGGWGLDWASTVLPQVDTVEVAAFVDASPEVRARAAETLGQPKNRFFASLDEALEGVEADAVMAILPTLFHKDIAEQGLRAGKHVLCEKPFTSTLEEAQALIDLSARTGRLLMVSQNYRYHSTVAEVTRLVQAHTYGRPLSATIDFRQYWKATGHRYHDIPGPLLLDMGIHHFDLLRLIFGENVDRVACRSWNTPSSPFRDHGAAHALIAMESGIVVSYTGSWLRRGVPTAWTGEWAIECEEGELVWSARQGRQSLSNVDHIQLRRPDGSVEELPVSEIPFSDRAGSLDAFGQAVASGTVPKGLSTAADNIRSLATSFACMRSGSSDGGWIEIDRLIPEMPHA